MELQNPLYSPARYLAVLSVLDYQGKSNVEDIDFYAHSEVSLEPEIESLENLGLLEESNGDYWPNSEYREDIQELGELVQIDHNGEWKEIDISEEYLEEISEERTEIIHWLT